MLINGTYLSLSKMKWLQGKSQHKGSKHADRQGRCAMALTRSQYIGGWGQRPGVQHSGGGGRTIRSARSCSATYQVARSAWNTSLCLRKKVICRYNFRSNVARILEGKTPLDKHKSSISIHTLTRFSTAVTCTNCSNTLQKVCHHFSNHVLFSA